jgi:hypothetical protein
LCSILLPTPSPLASSYLFFPKTHLYLSTSQTQHLSNSRLRKCSFI